VRVLFDQGTPVPLRLELSHHEVITAHECGWSRLTNGDLLDAAVLDGFALLVTTDANLRYQQHVAARRIGIVVLGTASWPRIRGAIGQVLQAIDASVPGSRVEVEIP
jgi:hypothetical protein